MIESSNTLIKIFIILVILFVSLIVIARLGKLLFPKYFIPPIERFFKGKYLLFVREIERMHNDNESKGLVTDDKEIYERVTGESTKGENQYDKFLGLNGWEDADPKSDLYICGNYINELMLNLNRRYVYENLKFEIKKADEVLKEYSLNIKDDEELIYKVSNLVDLFEEKSRIKNITYSGFSTNFRSGSMRYKIGNLTPFPQRENYWQLIDRSKLFMLRNKMIFVGTHNKVNKVIKYDDILTGEIFSNGVLLSLANSHKILIDFPEFKNDLVKRDDRNIFTRVLQRILENTVDRNILK